MRGTRHTNKPGDYDIQIYKYKNGDFVSTYVDDAYYIKVKPVWFK